MPVSAKAGSFNITTGAASSTVAVTGVGFTPKLILFWWSGRTESSNTAGGATHLRGFGFSDASLAFRCVGSREEDAAANAIADAGHRADACIMEMGNGSQIGWADVQSYDADGFTLEILDAFSVNLRVSYLAIGGTSITNAECGTFTTAGVAPTNQTISNAGNFPPAITFFIAVPSTSNAPASIVDSSIMFGAGINGSSDYVWFGSANDTSATMLNGSYSLGGECIAMTNTAPNTGPTDRAEFVSHNAGPGGFTINWLARANAHRIHYLSIGGGDWALGDLLSQTDTTTTVTETGLASQPSAVLFVSHAKAQTTGGATIPDVDEWSMGAATSATERTVQAASSRDAVADSQTATSYRDDAVYVNIAVASDAEEGRGDLTGMTSDGFSFIMDDADPSQAFVWWASVGPAPSGSTTLNASAATIGLKTFAATLLAGAVTLSAAAATVGLAAPTATRTASVTLGAASATTGLAAPTATVQAGASTRTVVAAAVGLAAPPATAQAGSVTATVAPGAVGLSAPTATAIQSHVLLASGVTVGVSVPTATATGGSATVIATAATVGLVVPTATVQGGSVTRTATVATLGLSTPAPTIQQASILSAASGTVGLSAPAATIAGAGTATIQAGQVVVGLSTPTAAVVAGARSLSAAAATSALAAPAATVSLSLSVTSAALGLSAPTATATAGSLTVSVSAATVALGAPTADLEGGAELPSNIIESTIVNRGPARTLVNGSPDRSLVSRGVTRTVEFIG